MKLTPILLAIAALSLGACNRAPPPDAAATAVLEFAAADLVNAELRPMAPMAQLSGTLRPWREATVKAKVAGELMALGVREGDTVKQGQVIGRIDATDYRARLAGSEADVAAAQAALGVAEKNQTTQESLLAKNFISRNAYDTTAGNRDAAKARLDAARAAADVGRKALADTTLVAPIDGIVSARIVQAGERVPVDGRIVTVSDITRLELAASVPAAEAARLAPGAEIDLTVEGLDDLRIGGRIERINPSAAPGSRSIELYAVIDNREGRLRGGLFAQGQVTAGAAQEYVVVPASALREEGGDQVLYVLAGDKVQRRQVKTAIAQGGWVAVTSGLAAGESVVRYNLGPLKDGASAKIKPAAAPAVPVAAPVAVRPAPTS
ncbi:MAG: efflux RND transporter periplasmic adaptor subunit [Rhodocyclaceae bacterium]|nr:MAG: efflux RND transporter periplasmic adaptor subunit [Rhodocyclaceae bacterium]